MAKLLVKAGVRPRSLYIAAAIANVAAMLTEPESVVITSGNDGRHMTGSKHYEHAALDVRTKTFATLKRKQAFVDAVLRRLGPDYQGFLEDVGGTNEHAHFEYDPS